MGDLSDAGATSVATLRRLRLAQEYLFVHLCAACLRDLRAEDRVHAPGVASDWWEDGDSRGLGRELPTAWFLQDIED